MNKSQLTEEERHEIDLRVLAMEQAYRRWLDELKQKTGAWVWRTVVALFVFAVAKFILYMNGYKIPELPSAH